MAKKIETDRLIIRSTKREDGDFCLDIWLDDEMGKYLCDPPKEKAGDAYLKWKETVEEYSGCHYFVSLSKETGDYVGTCSVVPSENNEEWDLGYAVHKKYWKQGYATEMVKELIQFCRSNGAKSVTAPVAKENPGSNALLRKLGFYVEREGSFKKIGTDIVYEEYTYKLDLN